MRLDSVIGSKAYESVIQQLNQKIVLKNNDKEGHTIQERIQLCELKLNELEQKADFIENLSSLILKNQQKYVLIQNDLNFLN